MFFDDLALLSPLPIVQFKKGNLPRDGFLVPLSTTCRAHLTKDADVCRQHYKDRAGAPDGEFRQCPFGFTSVATHAGPTRIGLTGVIGFPRFQTPAERVVAKKHPAHRVNRDSMLVACRALNATAKKFQQIEQATVGQHSMALHEIRKLNGQVKQTAERLCQLESPHDPDGATPGLVKILKTSELMSRQFDVIEILANEELATLPLNSLSDIYKIFDKCARIYRTASKRISLESTGGFSPRMEVCDKTFPIIPSVLIENALKYSAAESDVRITIAPLGEKGALVEVSNVAALKGPLTDAVFERGYRGRTDTDGSGNGLYVAQLVAKQHSTEIGLSTSELHGGRTRVSFQVLFRTI
jgi:hypothetical protein